jgi:hypothetical protein
LLRVICQWRLFAAVLTLGPVDFEGAESAKDLFGVACEANVFSGACAPYVGPWQAVDAVRHNRVSGKSRLIRLACVIG